MKTKMGLTALAATLLTLIYFLVPKSTEKSLFLFY
jgi:hypothetical protein